MSYDGIHEVIIDFRRAHELAPDNPIIAYRLANSLSSDKDRAEKFELLKVVVKNGHGNMVENAKSDLARFYNIKDFTNFK